MRLVQADRWRSRMYKAVPGTTSCACSSLRVAQTFQQTNQLMPSEVLWPTLQAANELGPSRHQPLPMCLRCTFCTIGCWMQPMLVANPMRHAPSAGRHPAREHTPGAGACPHSNRSPPLSAKRPASSAWATCRRRCWRLKWVSADSPTGQYLSGAKRIDTPPSAARPTAGRWRFAAPAPTTSRTSTWRSARPVRLRRRRVRLRQVGAT